MYVNEVIICVAARYVEGTILDGTEKWQVCGASDLEVNKICAWERNGCPALL